VTAADSQARFQFGENWTAFLQRVNPQRIDSTCQWLQTMLGNSDLTTKTFLDVGCGSGLTSLAASRLNAVVYSFDFDAQCVACAKELKRRFASDADDWTIEQGSVLDEAYMKSLGTHDIVCSWGVLHHTGRMDDAIQAVIKRVKPGGLLFIAIYHDQGPASRRWSIIKQTYHRLPPFARPAFVASIATYYETKFAAVRLAKQQNPFPFAEWKRKANDRGMSVWHDWVDWVGGWPFEVATPKAIVDPMQAQGFKLIHLTTVGTGWGCNQYVFQSPHAP